MLALIYIPFFIIAILALIYYGHDLYAFIFGAPYVASEKERVAKMIELAEITPGKRVVDFGSGDGRIVIEAAKRGAIATGVEMNPLLLWWSRRKIKKAGLQDKAKIVYGDMWNFDLGRTDVLMLYLLPCKMNRLERKVRKQMRPETIIISNAFLFKDWQFSEKHGKVRVYRITN